MTIKYSKRRSVLIVADGPSATVMRTMYVPQEIYVIGVNGAVQWLPRVDAFFTLDPSERNRWLMQNQRPGVRYFAAVPSDYGTAEAASPAHGPPKERNVTFLRRVTAGGVMGSAEGMSNDQAAIHSGNSAWGALGIAHHMQAKRIGIVGVDGNQEPRVSGGRPNNLDHLPWLFSTYDGPAEVRNGSPRSAVQCFTKHSAAEVVQWLL